MPLRDHFHPPLSRKKNWEGFHGLWPGLMTVQLNQLLPARFEAEPSVHVGSEMEVDIAALDSANKFESAEGNLVFEMGLPTLAVEAEFPAESEYEVRIFDMQRNRRLVAAVEIVSPANKDRPESRQAFVGKCQALLKKGVSVTVVDLVTSKHFNLYTGLLDLLGQADPTFDSEPPDTYAVACRWIPRAGKHTLETWSHVLQIGQALPSLPLWLTDDFAISLDLEASYEQTCTALRIG
ncbi:MAG: DUF4058 family protein [Fimbriiglobus sp.]